MGQRGGGLEPMCWNVAVVRLEDSLELKHNVWRHLGMSGDHERPAGRGHPGLVAALHSNRRPPVVAEDLDDLAVLLGVGHRRKYPTVWQL